MIEIWNSLPGVTPEVANKLTLNLGIRYNLEFGPTERFNRQSWFDFDTVAPAVRSVRPK